MVEKPYEGQVRTKYSDSHREEQSEGQVEISAFSVATGSARVQVNLLVDPVLHGWINEWMDSKLFVSSAKMIKTQTSYNPG